MRASILSFLPFAASVLALNCNGYAELCDRIYSNVSFIGSHDAPFVGILPSDNQYDSITTQLNDGVRFLTAQTHDSDGTIELCHTYCILLDAGSLQSLLTTIKTWMDSNANEVVTLLITNGDAIDITLFGDVFATVGLDTYAYAPGSTLAIGDWPTLGTLISTGKRLLVFMDYHADTTKVPYILDEFTYYFETPYDTTDPTFPQCTVDRPSGASPNGRMILVNHNLDVDILGIDVPDTAAISTTNSLSSILAQSDICAGEYSRFPNVVLLDYVDTGNGIEAQNTLNGL